MAKYSVDSTKQVPFKTGLKTKKFDLECVPDNKTHKIVSFALTLKGKKEVIKTFPIKGSILGVLKKVETFINATF